jgi:P4 family phage/plasmid primase-like protien
MPTKLDLFLNGNPDGKSEKDRAGRKVTEAGKPFTLWSFENKEKWAINSDDMEEFYKLYSQDISDCVPRYLTEKSTPIGQMRVDLDFKYDGKLEEHKHTQAQVVAFAKAYMEEVRRYVRVPETVEIYVLEKRYPTFDTSKKISSSGIHMQVPAIKTRAGVEENVRRSLVRRMDDFFPDLGCRDNWEKIYDKQPLTHTNNWPLLGSKKQSEGAMPYMVKYVLDWDSETRDISVDDNINPTPTVELIKKLSVRTPRIEDETPLTEEGEKTTRPPIEPREVTRSVSRGRDPTRQAPDSRSSSPGRMYIEPLTEHKKKYISDHVMNLKEKRYTDYTEWILVGQCLKNIHPDLEDVFLDFSEQVNINKPGSYSQREAMSKWQSFSFRVDGERLSIKSLRYWSREDNQARFQEIEDGNVDRLIELAAETCTENDVAQVIYAKWMDEFKCSSYKTNEWYRFAGHIWRPTDSGVELLARLSKTIGNLFWEKEKIEGNRAEALDCSHKEFDPTCEACTTEKRKKQFNIVRLRLKTMAFKKNVMEECRVMFFDKDFALKLDENKNLIAFNNGVYDTMIRKFREGLSEDCISKCVNIDYHPSIRFHQFACWPELRNFLESILPNRSVREYCMKHLSRCLSGNYTQDFHILTGEGSNGKSMLMNLMMTCFGEYAYKVNIALFTQKRGKAGSAAPELVRMKGVRFVMMSEPDQDDTISEGFMKEVTGSEKMTVRDLYSGSKQMIELDIQAKFHMACNVKPKVNDTSNGAWRRLKVVDFPNKFVHDPKAPNELPIDESIMSKTQSPEWAECFMTYLIHLYEEGMGHPKLKAPKEVDAFTQEYKVESDTIARFLTEYVHDPEQQPGDPEVEVPDQVSWQTITNTFQEWKRSNDVRAGNTMELKKRLETKYGKMPRNGWSAFRFGAGE